MTTQQKESPHTSTDAWEGLYIGGNVGEGWASNPLPKSAPQATLVTVPFNGSLLWNRLPQASSLAFTGGGQIGYNLRTKSILVGVETDFQYYGVHAKNSSTFIPSTSTTTTLTNQISTTTPWFGTVRGKIGTNLVNKNLFFYGTGGFAYGREHIYGTINVVDSNTPVVKFPFDRSSIATGFVAGAGAEWLLGQSWSIGAEYLCVNLGKQHNQTVRTTILGPAALETDAMKLKPSLNILNTVKITITRWF
ncbi:MAG: outer membrane beta-barrel protein [Legionellaceae bacterium]|nr:outer membrane beta-barrel protein [Legionellaceae bacterium]